MKLGKIMLFASDLETAEDFYCSVLGFPLASASESRLELVHDGCDLVIFKCEKDAEIVDYSNAARSVFVFEVESVDEKMAEMKGRGVNFLHEHPAENDASRYAAFSDPFGNVHEIFERR